MRACVRCQLWPKLREPHVRFGRAISTAVLCLFVFGATLAVEGIWSALECGV